MKKQDILHCYLMAQGIPTLQLKAQGPAAHMGVSCAASKDLLSFTQPILCFCRATQTLWEEEMGQVLFSSPDAKSEFKMAERSRLILMSKEIVGIDSDDSYPVSKAFT